MHTAGSLIKSVHVESLFGRRSYDLEFPNATDGDGRLALLHGENGSGKTTILRLIWNALSAADERGHRTFLARTPFKTFRVETTAGATISVEKAADLLGTFSVTLSRPGHDDSTALFETDESLAVPSAAKRRPLSAKTARLLQTSKATLSASDRRALRAYQDEIEQRVASLQAEQEYLKFLRTEVRAPLYLADDRSLYSDDPEIERTRELLRSDDVSRRDRLAKLVFLELHVILRRVNEYLRGLALGGQNDGSANTNGIYASVLRQLSTATPLAPRPEDGGESVALQLDRIRNIAPGFERFGLVPKFDVDEFIDLLARARERTLDLGDLAERIVYPYVSSLNARYDALQDAHDVLNALVPTINSFLNEKELRFTPWQGLAIVSADGAELEVESLSSGERQLLMLLCTTLLARTSARLFIIDEPELSLGVGWQRKILDALLLLTERSEVQFLVATHSIEIISGHPGSLVQLRPR